MWSGSYSVFGELKRSNGELDFTPSFTGKQFDSDTGLTYFNARFYDASIGRFVNVDPIRDGVNWYAYCFNNPLNFTDPTGLGGEKEDTTPLWFKYDENNRDEAWKRWTQI